MGGKWVKVSLRREVYEKLVEYARGKGLTSLSDAVAILLEHATVSSKIEELLATLSSKVDGLLTTVSSKVDEIHATLSSKTQHHHATVSSKSKPLHHAVSGVVRDSGFKRRRKSIREVIGDLKVQLLSEVKPRNPSAFLRKAREEGVVIVEGAKGDVALVDPEFWAEFKTLLKHLPYRLEEAEIELGGEEEKLFKFLRENALIYFDSKENRWKSTVNNLQL